MVKTVRYNSFLSEKDQKITLLESVALAQGFLRVDYGSDAIHFKKDGHKELYVVGVFTHCIETVFVPRNSRREVREYALQLGKAFERNMLGKWCVLQE